MGWKIELAWTNSTVAKLRKIVPQEIIRKDRVALGIGDEQTLTLNEEPGRPFHFVRDFQEILATFREDDDSRSPGVGHINKLVALGDGHGRDETCSPHLLPAAPDLLPTIIEANRIDAGIGETQILFFIHADTKGFAESLILLRSTQPAAKSCENRGPYASVARLMKALHINDTRVLRRFRPTQGG